jgi:S1-C subfamily serine protease
MMTANVFRRTFFIRYGDATGTAFTVEQDKRQYLVTAAHVCEGIKDGVTIFARRHDRWDEWPVKIVGMGGHGMLEADVAVFALPHQISPSFPMPATSQGIVWGQEVFFLGYPYGLHTTLDVNNGYPLAMIKRGLMSGSRGDKSGGETFLLDGHNNPGFSGGPVVFRPHNNASLDFQVLGVVSAYRTENVDVFFEGKPTGLTSPMNTGIVVCPSIKRVTDMISANPIGPEITT